jgi:hypothetical protein
MQWSEIDKRDLEDREEREEKRKRRSAGRFTNGRWFKQKTTQNQRRRSPSCCFLSLVQLPAPVLLCSALFLSLPASLFPQFSYFLKMMGYSM